ncbi:MAG: hypothetical protein M3Q69_08550 [Acidobacteriota bacterium]|nr:hypothetical protein [Acidobacteriota bacterium]
MNAADSINATDRKLLQRLGILAAALFVFTAAFATLQRTYAQKFYDTTGHAKWIWAQHRMSDNLPVAFFAARDFDIPEKRVFAHLKILGDPEYTVFLNGSEVASRNVGEDRTLDFYDASALVKTGRNRIVIAVRSPQGIGGLIASIDIAPEVANWVVTDGSWKIYRTWSPEILVRDTPRVVSQSPAVIGEPPIGRWNYLALAPQELSAPFTQIQQPRESFEQIGYVPTIRTKSGVAVAGKEKERAKVFDFGPSGGHIRLTVPPKRLASDAILLRFASTPEELALAEWHLRRVVVAPGESVVVTPESYVFRYVMVFGEKDVRVEAVSR